MSKKQRKSSKEIQSAIERIEREVEGMDFTPKIDEISNDMKLFCEKHSITSFAFAYALSPVIPHVSPDFQPMLTFSCSHFNYPWQVDMMIAQVTREFGKALDAFDAQRKIDIPSTSFVPQNGHA